MATGVAPMCVRPEVAQKKSELLAASAPVPPDLTRRLGELREKLAFLRSDLSLASPELLSLVAVSPLSLERIQKSIPEGTLVADYHLLADRVVMMTNGPEATIGRIVDVDLPRPRTRKALLEHPDYYRYREQVLSFLEEYEHGAKPKPKAEDRPRALAAE